MAKDAMIYPSKDKELPNGSRKCRQWNSGIVALVLFWWAPQSLLHSRRLDLLFEARWHFFVHNEVEVKNKNWLTYHIPLY